MSNHTTEITQVSIEILVISNFLKFSMVKLSLFEGREGYEDLDLHLGRSFSFSGKVVLWEQF